MIRVRDHMLEADMGYVPLRVFVADGDLYSEERDFGVSPWTVLVVLGLPTLVAFIWFVARVIAAIFTAAFVTGFYGLGGLLEDDPGAHLMGLICSFEVTPLIAVGFLAQVWPHRT